MFEYYLIGMGVVFVIAVFNYGSIVRYIAEGNVNEVTDVNSMYPVYLCMIIGLIIYPVTVVVLIALYLFHKSLKYLSKVNKRILDKDTKRK